MAPQAPSRGRLSSVASSGSSRTASPASKQRSPVRVASIDGCGDDVVLILGRCLGFASAHLAELVDALVLGTSDFGCASSSLAVGIPFPRLVSLVAAGNTGIFR